MKKHVLTTILAGALALTALAGCGNSNAGTGDDAGAQTGSPAPEQEQAGTENSDSGTSGGTDDAADAGTDSTGDTSGAAGTKGTITVAASATPHAELLEQAKPLLAEQGWDTSCRMMSWRAASLTQTIFSTLHT